MRRAEIIDAETFKALLAAGYIRPMYLYDTQHNPKRKVYRHPNTGAPYIETK